MNASALALTGYLGWFLILLLTLARGIDCSSGAEQLPP